MTNRSGWVNLPCSCFSLPLVDSAWTLVLVNVSIKLCSCCLLVMLLATIYISIWATINTLFVHFLNCLKEKRRNLEELSFIVTYTIALVFVSFLWTEVTVCCHLRNFICCETGLPAVNSFSFGLPLSALTQ